ncbi:MAG: hypothetical protein IH899_03195 [Planctomycetes bacterium]|nr:hypothetical protein [Planctomycetota bacterium]
MSKKKRKAVEVYFGTSETAWLASMSVPLLEKWISYGWIKPKLKERRSYRWSYMEIMAVGVGNALRVKGLPADFSMAAINYLCGLPYDEFESYLKRGQDRRFLVVTSGAANLFTPDMLSEMVAEDPKSIASCYVSDIGKCVVNLKKRFEFTLETAQETERSHAKTSHEAITR